MIGLLLAMYHLEALTELREEAEIITKEQVLERLKEIGERKETN